MVGRGPGRHRAHPRLLRPGRPATLRADAPGALPLGPYRQMLAGRMVAVSSLEELPAEAAVDRETCRLFGIKSDLMPPALGGGRAARGRPGLQRPAGAARLAGRAGEAAATGRAGLHQRARPEAPRAEPAGRARLAWRRAPTSPASRSTRWTSAERIVFIDDRFRDLCGIPPERRAGPRRPGVLDGAPASRRPPARAGPAPAAARREAGAAHHRVSLPASDPRGEVDSSHGPRRPARRRRTRGQDVRRPPRHHGETASARRPCGSRTRRSSD